MVKLFKKLESYSVGGESIQSKAVLFYDYTTFFLSRGYEGRDSLELKADAREL